MCWLLCPNLDNKARRHLLQLVIFKDEERKCRGGPGPHQRLGPVKAWILPGSAHSLSILEQDQHERSREQKASGLTPALAGLCTRPEDTGESISQLLPGTPRLGQFLQGLQGRAETGGALRLPTTELPSLWVWEPALPGGQASLAFTRPHPQHLEPFPSGPAG